MLCNILTHFITTYPCKRNVTLRMVGLLAETFRWKYHNEYTWFVSKVSVLLFYLIIYWTYLKLQVISFEV
jgi:hypothetical protein